MLSELNGEEIQVLPEQLRLCLPGLVETLENAQNALPEILQLPRKRRAREAYHWYMLLVKETNSFLEALESLCNKE